MDGQSGGDIAVTSALEGDLLHDTQTADAHVLAGKHVRGDDVGQGTQAGKDALSGQSGELLDAVGKIGLEGSLLNMRKTAISIVE